MKHKKKKLVQPVEKAPPIHSLVVGDTVTINKDHRRCYAYYRNADGTLKNPKYKVIGLRGPIGVLVESIRHPENKHLIDYTHLTKEEKSET